MLNGLSKHKKGRKHVFSLCYSLHVIRELLATQQKLDTQSKEAAEKARKAHQDGIRFLRESMDK